VITHGDLDRQNPEVEAIIEGRTGGFFRRGDAIDLARVIRTWVTGSRPRDQVRRDCIDVIERFYNPRKQAEIIGQAVAGIPATQVQDASRPFSVAFATAEP
jgi:hypothetical protein